MLIVAAKSPRQKAMHAQKSTVSIIGVSYIDLQAHTSVICRALDGRERAWVTPNGRDVPTVMSATEVW